MNRLTLRLNDCRSTFSLALLVVASALIFALALSGRAFADTQDPAIIYDGAARQLTVQGSQGSATETDLFPAFKGLMPGDQRQQDVQVRVSGVSSEVRLYVKAAVDDEASRALAPISLAASLVDGDGEAALQEGSAGNVFSGGVCVARFSRDGQAVLRLSLRVPTSVSNELADANERIRWEITAEDDSGAIEPTPAVPSGNAPAGAGVAGRLTQTGDGAVSIAAALAVIAAAAAAAVIARCRISSRK